jgi:hypothetical protein
MLVSQEEANKAVQIEVIPEEVDFGRVFDGDSPVKEFTVKNRSDEAMTLKRVSTSCGCAVPRIHFPGGKVVELNEAMFGKELGELGPGEEARVEVSFTTWGYKGKLLKHITVQTQGAKTESHSVSVLAEIIDSVKMKPEVLDLGEVVRGQQTFGETIMRSVGIGDFEITGIRNLPAYLEYKTERLAEGDEAAFSVALAAKENAPLGDINLVLQLTVENKHIEVVRLPFKATVIPKVDFLIKGERIQGDIDLGVFSANRGCRLSVEIVNLVPMIPYHVRHMQVKSSKDTAFIDAEIESIEPGVRYQLDLSIKPGAPAAGFVRGSIILESDHPDMLQKELHLMGWSSGP